MNRYLLPLFLVSFEFLPAELYSWFAIGLAGLLLVIGRPRFFFSAQNPIWPLVVLLFVGLCAAVNHPLVAVFKDIWYTLKPIGVLSLGLMMAFAFRSDKDWIKPVTLVVVLVSIGNIFIALTQAELGTVRPTSYLASFMGPFIWKYYPSRTLWGYFIRSLALSLVIAMIYLSESRAALLTLGVSWLVAAGVLQARARALFLMATLALLAFTLAPLIPQYDFQSARYLAKLQNSINEVMFETGGSSLNMYRNWRGFEAYRAFNTWKDAPFFNQLVGLGHGAHIDLGAVVNFNDKGVNSLSSIHNGYFAVLVKTGVIGLAALVIFMLQPFRMRFDTSTKEADVFARMIRGGAITFLFLSALISGVMNKTSVDALLLIWGWAYGRLILDYGMAHASRPRPVRPSQFQAA